MNPPFLTAAVFCENALREQDGVFSLIRVIDKIFVERLGTKEQEGVVPTRLFIGFKSGGYSGKGKIRLVPISPSGKRLKVSELEIDFPKDPQAGVNIDVRADVAVQEEGVYWFEIYCNDELATRTPLDVQLWTPAIQQALLAGQKLP